MTSFDSLGLSGPLVTNLTQLGFLNPTPVQEKVIPALLQGSNDLVALAQTGTGKTAAFGLPLIELCNSEEKHTQALVLAPTRELCVQITKDLTNYCSHVKPLNMVAVYGGASIQDQIGKIKRGAQVVIATPGRLMDLLERKAVNLSKIEYLVLDEADEMLNMGFRDDIDHILKHTPEFKNVWLFSATMPPEVRRIAQTYMEKPLEITIGTKNKGNENIEHRYMMVSDKDRYAALKRVMDYYVDIFGIIFCRTKMDTQRIAEHLIKDGYNADAIHGDLSQAQRDRVMNAFKSKTLQMLVATDVAARGIDVNNITHVIHLNIPDELEYYTHRSGRTARAGKKGVSISIISPREQFKIKQIEKTVGAEFIQQQVPTGHEVCSQRLLGLVHRLREVRIAEDEISPLLPAVYSELMHLDKEEIIKRFASLEFNHLLDYYRDATDLNRDSRGGSRDRDSHSGSERYVTGERLFISLGKMDGLDKGKLLGMICDRCGFNRDKIGHIEIKGAYSFFETEQDVVQTVKDSLHGMEFKGRIVRIETTGAGGTGGSRGEKKRGGYGGSRQNDRSGSGSNRPRKEKSFHSRSSEKSFSERSHDKSSKGKIKRW